jgi:hypothetical protein
MEIRSGVLQPGRLAVLLHVGQDQDVRIVRMMELVDHVRLRRAEPFRERDELRRGELLPAQHEHLACVERALELGESVRGERARDVDVAGLQSEASATAVRTWPWADFPASPSERLLQEFGADELRQQERDPRPDDHRGEHEQHRHQHISVSLSAYRNRTFAIAQEIIRHRP